MSIIPPIAPEVPNPERRGSRWLLPSLVVSLTLFLLLCWFFWARLRRTEVQLQAAAQRLEMLAGKQESLNTDLRQSREQTQTAREETRAAEERAAKSELAHAQAAKEAEQAQAARTLADQQAQRAQQQAQNAREELDQIRKAREEELNRMQEGSVGLSYCLVHSWISRIWCGRRCSLVPERSAGVGAEPCAAEPRRGH